MKKHVVQVDAIHFEKRIGDCVHTGERLGEWNNQPVYAPIDGYVESVAFNPEHHSLIVTLERQDDSPDDQDDWAIFPVPAIPLPARFFFPAPLETARYWRSGRSTCIENQLALL